MYTEQNNFNYALFPHYSLKLQSRDTTSSREKAAKTIDSA